MELSEIYDDKINGSNPKISFEIFPPKNGNILDLFEELRIMKKFNPVLVSLTYGASGALNRFSFQDLKSIRDLELNLMPHFTCVSMLKHEIENYITSIENLGIVNILALRGDIPDYINPQDLDFIHADELVAFIRDKTTLSIGVAGYPEGHIECKNIMQDLDCLKSKIDKGASAVFTQMFFDNDKFYKYYEAVNKYNLKVPIIPGIMPIRNLKQIEKMMSMARITFPKKLKEQLEKFPADSKKIGTEYCIHQCQELLDFGVKGLHFFTLNHSDQVSEILENI